LLPVTAAFFVVGGVPRTASFVALAIGVLLGGYEMTVARYVLTRAPLWPPLSAEGVNVVRRAASILALVFAPLWLAAYLLSLITSIPWEPLSTIAGNAALVMLLSGGLVLVPAGTVAFGSRYIHFDSLREGFRYGDGAKHLRRHWREGLVAMSFSPIWALATLTLRFTIGSMLGVTNLRAIDGGVWSLVASGAWTERMGIVLGLLAVSAFSAVGALVWAHLLGQYSLVAYGAVRESESVEQAHPADGQKVD